MSDEESMQSPPAVILPLHQSNPARPQNAASTNDNRGLTCDSPPPLTRVARREPTNGGGNIWMTDAAEEASPLEAHSRCSLSRLRPTIIMSCSSVSSATTGTSSMAACADGNGGGNAGGGLHTSWRSGVVGGIEKGDVAKPGTTPGPRSATTLPPSGTPSEAPPPPAPLPENQFREHSQNRFSSSSRGQHATRAATTSSGVVPAVTDSGDARNGKVGKPTLTHNFGVFDSGGGGGGDYKRSVGGRVRIRGGEMDVSRSVFVGAEYAGVWEAESPVQVGSLLVS